MSVHFDTGSAMFCNLVVVSFFGLRCDRNVMTTTGIDLCLVNASWFLSFARTPR